MILLVGIAAENQDSMTNLRKSGFNAMREVEFHTLLDTLCNPANEPSTPLVSQITNGLEMLETMQIKGLVEPA